MTETTTPPAALSVGRLARAIYDAALATNAIPHPAWDQLDAAEIQRFRTMAGLVIERLGGGAAAGCQECASGLEHDTHCRYPESHNWGCGCPSDERPGR